MTHPSDDGQNDQARSGVAANPDARPGLTVGALTGNVLKLADLGIATTFTSSCPFGCKVHTVDGIEQAHVCVGVAVIEKALRGLVNMPANAHGGAVVVAKDLEPLLRERLFEAWKDGVHSGRRGPCYGVGDDDIPEGSVASVPLKVADAFTADPSAVWTIPTDDGPRLGLATTGQLLDEIRTRIEIDGHAGGGGLDYRTVDGDRPGTMRIQGSVEVFTYPPVAEVRTTGDDGFEWVPAVAPGDLAERIADVLHRMSGAQENDRCEWCLVQAERICDEVLKIPTPPTGAELMAAERRRQVEEEGYDLEHDRQHGWYTLGRAANAYRYGDRNLWPRGWDWKPKDRLSDLIRAGALHLAAADVAADEGEFGARDAARRAAGDVGELIDELLARAREILTGGAA